MTHISLNPHLDNLPNEVRNIETYVFLQKELDFNIAKRRYIEEKVAFCVNDDLKRELLQEIHDIEEQIRYLRSEIPENAVTILHQVIKSYMQVYRLTTEDVSKLTKVKKEIIKESLEKGFSCQEGKRFALWAILTFRLDANQYLRQLKLV